MVLARIKQKNTVNLKDALKDDKISGLTWLNNFNLDYDASTIQTTLTNVG